MFFDNFASKFFNTNKKQNNLMDDDYFYDSNGVIKNFEKIIKIEKKILDNNKKTLDSAEKFRKEHPKNDFAFLIEQMNRVEYHSQVNTVHVAEDFVYIMKNMVALEKGVNRTVSIIEKKIAKILDHPKFKEDNKLWKEMKDEHLPLLRDYQDIMKGYAEKRLKDLERGK